jgi:hypothetical protein
MPDVSQRQRRAMFAAKEGNSTLGIPKSVGADFIAADAAAGNPKLPKKANPEHAKRLAAALHGGRH